MNIKEILEKAREYGRQAKDTKDNDFTDELFEKHIEWLEFRNKHWDSPFFDEIEKAYSNPN